MDASAKTHLVQAIPASRPMESATSAEADAFDGVVREHQRRIYRILLGFVRDAETAANLTQECFLRAFERRHSYRGETGIGTWLVRIALNLARDHGRSRRAGFWRRIMGDRRAGDAVETTLGVPDPAPAADRAAMARQRLAAVWAVMDRLPSRQRTCFLLRFVEAMSLEEIAEAMRVEVGTVKSHLARATGAVRRRVSAWEGTCEDI